MDSRKIESMYEETDQLFFNTVSNLVSTAIEKSRECQELHKRTEALNKGCPQEMIGSSEPMMALYSEMNQVAPTNASVLILGESGTGKELLACAIHRLSPRRDKPFVPVECGSLPETLLESELFGYKKGAFTGAFADKPGLFEEANEGTVFIDEITSASLSAQAKLLRFLQEGEIRRLGENRPRRVNVRIICATNKNLEEEVKANRLREDLYYRLRVVSLEMPPLKERGNDILLLAEHFRRVYAAQFGKPVRGFTRDAVKALLKSSWEGNVRELQHAIESAVILCQGQYVSLNDLKISSLAKGRALYQETLETQKRVLVEKALYESKGNVSRAAAILGMAPRQLNRLMKRFGILGQKGRGRPKKRNVS